MKAFTNQFNFRVDNQLKFINLLRHTPQSIYYLAEHADISFSAADRIVDQLVSFDILTKNSEYRSSVFFKSFLSIFIHMLLFFLLEE